MQAFFVRVHFVPGAYVATVERFLSDPQSEILSALVSQVPRLGFQELQVSQVPAWTEEIDILKIELARLLTGFPDAREYGVVLEFVIPRRQRRIDAVLLGRNVIVVLEFKTGQGSSALRQGEEYALDLADFHVPSRPALIFPVVVSTAATGDHDALTEPITRVCPAREVPPNQTADSLRQIFSRFSRLDEPVTCVSEWNRGEYRPVPSIVEAACALYAGADVREIANAGACKESLNRTTQALLEVIESAQAHGSRAICFVTGVPGAGKTLVGLNAIHNRHLAKRGVFLSGNGPLVKILREALARDQRKRESVTKRRADRDASVFIQNMHDFVRQHFGPDAVRCSEHVIVFDEAQRAWDAAKNKKKIKQEVSEPEILLSIMDKAPNWAVVIALIGGGQEIHDGEAGLSEWGRTLAMRFPHWMIFAPQEVTAGVDALAGARLFDHSSLNGAIHLQPQLHLPISARTVRSEYVTAWVNRVLAGKPSEAQEIANSIREYPLVLTRNLDTAKQWLRTSTLGGRRFGLIGSSGATRLRAYGIEPSSEFHRSYPFERWFLDDRDDYRSSFQLEVMATEFEIQGLEIDRTCLCWGGDLLWNSSASKWALARLVGTKWKALRSGWLERYLQNKYRVLMTRARDGMVVWIPGGDENDATRPIGPMNETAEYLGRCGMVSLDANATQVERAAGAK